MAQAETSRIQFAIVPETTYGVTPSTPQLQLIEHVNFNGVLNTTALTDPSRGGPARQTTYSRRGNSSTAPTLEVIAAPLQHDLLYEAVLMGTWTGDELMVGTTKRSFTGEEGLTDLALYRVWTGLEVNTWTLNITPEALVTSTFGFIGSDVSAFTGTTLDATPTAVPAADKFYHEGGSFNEGGASVGWLSALSMEVNNGITGTYGLGALGYRNLAAGKVAITGTASGAFETAAVWNKFRNNTDTSISFTLSASGHTFQVNLPRVKYTSGTITTTGAAGVTVEMGFEAIYDATLGNTARLVRT
jgi:hypothetical protein